MNSTPGFKTTEFWTALLSAVALGSDAVPGEYSVQIAAISGIYVAARTLLKAILALKNPGA